MEPLALPPLLEPIRRHIEGSLRPRLALGFRDDAGTSLRGTRLGGEPATAPGTTWPMGGNGPLTFIGQLDFEELARLGMPELGLPDAGILALFHDLSAHPRRGDAAYQLMWAPRDVQLLARPPAAQVLPRRVLDSTRADIPSMPHFFLDCVPHAWPGWDDVGEDEDGNETACPSSTPTSTTAACRIRCAATHTGCNRILGSPS
ncbi:MAG: DUF1963 domain-containing protein [Polyangiales bacterium]